MSEADELEREAEAARARLADTADQIRARMSPGQLMDEVLNQFRDGDGSLMLTNLKTQARDNPMALALIGSGLAWLMMGSGVDAQEGGRGASYGASPGASPSYPGTSGAFSGSSHGIAGDTGSDWGRGLGSGGTGSGGTGGSSSLGGLAQSASEALSSARDSMSGRLHGAGDRLHAAGSQAGEWAEGVRSTGGEWAEGLRSAGGETIHGMRHAAEGMRHSAAGFGEQAKDGFLGILEREPLVIGALGVAVGAAIGALLPATELERQHLGPAGEALKEKAGSLASQGMAEAKHVASEVYASAREEADRQGLLPGDQPIAEKIDTVVRAAGKTAGEAVEQRTSGGEESSSGASSGGGKPA